MPPVQVHITIDDLPWMVEAGYSVPLSEAQVAEQHQVLQAVLERHQVKVSVFFNCGRLRPGDGTVGSWSSAGHTLGNHTWSHLRLAEVEPSVWLADAARCHEFLTAELGQAPRWLRYPYLSYGADRAARDEVTAGLAALGERTAPVTLATTEWLHAYTYRRALRLGSHELREAVVDDWHRHMDAALDEGVRLSMELTGRSVAQTVLVHMNELVIDELGELIDRWKRRGVVFVDLETAMADPIFQRDNLYTGPAGLSWLWRVQASPSWKDYWFGLEQGRIEERFGPVDASDKGVRPPP